MRAHRISVSVAVAVVLGPIVCRRGGTRGQPRPSVERSSPAARTPLRSRVSGPAVVDYLKHIVSI
ncbi:hypothetical protein BJV78DRAFT_1270326 [Lactifluus subvellereus]|nr:hypothetical protein BJV78DRAFT_1270326 [Lactifluus subvellereus]